MGDAELGQIKVLLVDDQSLIRMGFRMVLEACDDITVVGEAADGRTGLQMVKALHPDVVLMDVRMPVLDGLQAATRILEMHAPQSHVIMLTTFDLDEYVYSAVRAGASGFLLKDAPPEELLGAVRTVYRGDAVIAPSATRRLLKHMIPVLDTSRENAAAEAPPQEQPVLQHQELIEQLTPREYEVLKLVAEGLSNSEIGRELVLSEATIKTHVSHVLNKLDARDRVQAVIMAYEAGIVS